MKSLFSSHKTTALQHRNAMAGGSYSLILTAVVLAILVVVNVLAAALPTSLTKFDISATKLYSVTSNTKAVVHALTDDVTIYWIVQADEEDDILSNLLSKYESLSDHITVEKRNPDVYPTFAEQYTDETVENNSLVVVCGDRSRYIPLSDIYLTETDYSSYYPSYSYSFDGEGAITSAIDYVTREELPQVYQLEGHGEQELPVTFADQIEKNNLELQTLSLLNVDEIPEDAACILLYAPESDISEEERALLSDYIASGGKVLVISGPTEEGNLTTLHGLLADYGVTVHDGMVVEGDRAHYYFQSPWALMPDLNSSAITDSLIEERYYPIFTLAQGLTVDGTTDATLTELLTTSEEAFSKADGLNITTYEKEDGDTDGPFALAVSIEDVSGGQLVWFASSTFLVDAYNAYSSGANVNLAMNALSSLVGETEAMAIRSKSLDYNYLTISESTSSLLKTVMIGVFPLVYLGIGIGIVVRRRKRQHAAV
ncbi:MAG TPA: GldG family protein [Candidatus Avoscillospira stercoripullorum]|uniref:GldG family protein n=1 Tax=Candidatus Avoscillospira stercoripullorum TaxID=2840709 RepID=A0A9D1A8Q2_9FIRM|nr:GldG family protein [Candidatus Avoscillospira stercoripullorum]